jgi:hypothetical protein
MPQPSPTPSAPLGGARRELLLLGATVLVLLAVVIRLDPGHHSSRSPSPPVATGRTPTPGLTTAPPTTAAPTTNPPTGSPGSPTATDTAGDGAATCPPDRTPDGVIGSEWPGTHPKGHHVTVSPSRSRSTDPSPPGSAGATCPPSTSTP